VTLNCLDRWLTLAHLTPCRLPDHPHRAGKPWSISSWSRPLPAGPNGGGLVTFRATVAHRNDSV